MTTLTAEDRDRIAYSANPADHQGLVRSIAKTYRGRGMDYDDLVGHGNVGLVEASRRYKPARRIRFNTYASYWVHRLIRRALVEEQWPIRVPEYAVAAMRRADRGEARPGKDEAIRLARAATACSCSSPAWLGELAVDCGDRTAEDEDEACWLRIAIRYLPVRHRGVLVRRYGLGRGEAQTCEEIGADLGVTRERVRQIEAEAIEGLKALAARDRA